MSYYWTPICETCGEDGPQIRSGHSGLKFGPDHATSSESLQRWLDQHEHHDVWLRGSGMPSRVSRVIAMNGKDTGDVLVRVQDASSSAQNRFSVDVWDPEDAVGVRLSVAPGTRQILGNSGDRPLHLRARDGRDLDNRFVFPDGVTEVVVPPHGSATFVAEMPPTPSRWQRLWRWVTRRPAPRLQWRYQSWDKEASKATGPDWEAAPP